MIISQKVTHTPHMCTNVVESDQMVVKWIKHQRDAKWHDVWWRGSWRCRERVRKNLCDIKHQKSVFISLNTRIASGMQSWVFFLLFSLSFSLPTVSLVFYCKLKTNVMSHIYLAISVQICCGMMSYTL